MLGGIPVAAAYGVDPDKLAAYAREAADAMAASAAELEAATIAANSDADIATLPGPSLETLEAMAAERQGEDEKLDKLIAESENYYLDLAFPNQEYKTA